jgi:hypothetical protein
MVLGAWADAAETVRAVVPVATSIRRALVRLPPAGLHPRNDMRMFMRMARIQVYLPDDLYALVKERGLPASQLLQEAVRAEARRLALLEEAERYLDTLVAEVGQPTPEETARANAIVGCLARRAERRLG